MTSAKDNQIAVLQDRVQELEELLGINDDVNVRFMFLGMTKMMRRLLGLLMARDLVSKETIYAALYGSLPENQQPDIEVIGPWIFHLRNKLHDYDIRIVTVYGSGWAISPSDKARLLAVVAEQKEFEPLYRPTNARSPQRGVKRL